MKGSEWTQSVLPTSTARVTIQEDLKHQADEGATVQVLSEQLALSAVTE